MTEDRDEEREQPLKKVIFKVIKPIFEKFYFSPI